MSQDKARIIMGGAIGLIAALVVIVIILKAPTPVKFYKTNLDRVVAECGIQAVDTKISMASKGFSSGFDESEFQSCIADNGYKITEFPLPIKNK